MSQLHLIFNTENRDVNMASLRQRLRLGEGETRKERNEGLNGIEAITLEEPEWVEEHTSIGWSQGRVVVVTLATHKGTTAEGEEPSFSHVSILDDELLGAFHIVEDEISYWDDPHRGINRLSSVEFAVAVTQKHESP